jgi:hypothetical protein
MKLGSFLLNHRTEIVNLIEHTEKKEKPSMPCIASST